VAPHTNRSPADELRIIYSDDAAALRRVGGAIGIADACRLGAACLEVLERIEAQLDRSRPKRRRKLSILRPGDFSHAKNPAEGSE
jgi:hypothetical protein